jgi:formylmethanofuran dehydrogenase subunit E
MAELEDAISFHGHLCPMFYLGVRMGELALKKLNRGRERGVKLHAIVEFANCFGDGVQYVTGATFGKNNLHLDDKGKFAASFYDLATGASLRLRMKEDVVKKVLEYGRAGKDVKKLPPAERDDEAKRLMASGKEMVEWLKELEKEELFKVTPVGEFTPDDGPSLDYVICQNCGELTLKEYSKKKRTVTQCQSCYNFK